MKEKPERPPTIREVAKLARVGLMTVSRVINNNPRVRPSTLKKVNAAIATLGYQKNEAARLLKGQRAMMIGLIVPDLSDNFFAVCAHTIQQIARAHGYMTLVAASERDSELEIQQAELMASRKLSGLLVVTSTKDGDERLQQLQKTGLAIVAFDRPLTGAQTDAVVVENRSGAEEAVRHLIWHGHKRIACIGYDESVYAVRERIEGYKAAMHAAGLKPMLSLGIGTLEGTRQWVQAALKSPDRPTAAFTLNHRTATYLLRVLSDAGVAVPKEMALIGFDDFDLSALVSPPLTTVAQSPADLAKRAMALLIDRIGDQKRGAVSVPAKIVLPVTLIIRASCGCKPSTPAQAATT
jgi:LacI family transcriptional regulator, galactose operon repressor